MQFHNLQTTVKSWTLRGEKSKILIHRRDTEFAEPETLLNQTLFPQRLRGEISEPFVVNDPNPQRSPRLSGEMIFFNA